MSKINPDLQQLLDDAGPGASSPLRLIVTLEPGAEWHRAVEAVKAAGLHVEREEQAIHVLFGLPGCRRGDALEHAEKIA